MFILHVHVHVKPGHDDDFIKAVRENAEKSRQEPGVLRFDVVQQQGDPMRFILIEIYKTEEDAGRHKETEHYLKWRDTVADWMAEPRKPIKLNEISTDLG